MNDELLFCVCLLAKLLQFYIITYYNHKMPIHVL